MAMKSGSGNREEEQDLLQQALGGAHTMPVGQGAKFNIHAGDPRSQDEYQAHYDAGQAAGQDMSWMTQQAPAKGTSLADRKALGGYSGVGVMKGFNTNLDYPDDKAANSVKNTFGRIASRYAATPASLDLVLADPDFKRFFPNARKLEGGAGDKIDFGNILSDFESGDPVGVIDVGEAFDPDRGTGTGWAWQHTDGGGGAGMGGGAMDPMAMLGNGGTAIDDLGNTDVLAQILAELQKAAGGGENQTQQDLLQSLLTGA